MSYGTSTGTFTTPMYVYGDSGCFSRLNFSSSTFKKNRRLHRRALPAELELPTFPSQDGELLV